MGNLSIIGPSNRGPHPKLDSQRSINWYLVKPEAEGQPWTLEGRPGLEELSTLPRAPIRGWYVHKDRLFVVAKERVYEIFEDGTPTEWGRIATATGRVVMTGLLDTIVIGDGTGYSALDLDTGTVAPVTAAPRGTFCVTFDLRVLYQGENGEVFYSEVNDPTNIPGANFFTAESLPADLQAIATTEGQIWLISTDGTEIWYDSGDTDTPIQRVQGGVIYTGTILPFTVMRLDGSIWMVGKNKDGANLVLRSNGLQFARVSTSAVERWLKRAGEVTAFSYQEEGHTFYCLNSLDLTGEPSWAMDLATGEWAERAWLNPSGGVQERQRAEFHAFCYGIHLVGDYENGKIYRQGLDVRLDGTEEIRRTRISPHLDSNGRALIIDELFLDFATGVGLDGSGQGTDPEVMLRCARDGAAFGTEMTASIGRIGEYWAQARFWRLGMGRDWVLEISVSDPVFSGLKGADMKSRVGKR